MSTTLYGLLGIDSSASPLEVRAAYKKMALKFHPDKLGPGASEDAKQVAEANFHKVHEAFQLLSDRSKRRAYDVEMNIPVDYNKKWAHLDEEQQRRMKDRDEWARRGEERHQERMRVCREQMRLAREELRRMEREAAEQAAMVERLRKQLSAGIPD